MTPAELKLIKQIADDCAASRQLLETHTAQITRLFDVQGAHAEAITKIGTTQDLCQKRNDPGNKTERASLVVAIALAAVSFFWQIVNYFK